MIIMPMSQAAACVSVNSGSDQRLAAGELQPQHPGISHHLQQPFPAGPAHARERLFPEVAVLAVVVAAEVQLVASAGVPVPGLRPDQDRVADQAARQVRAPSGPDPPGEPAGDRDIKGRVAQFRVPGGPDPDCPVITGPDDDMPFGIRAGDELMGHERLHV